MSVHICFEDLEAGWEGFLAKFRNIDYRPFRGAVLRKAGSIGLDHSIPYIYMRKALRSGVPLPHLTLENESDYIGIISLHPSSFPYDIRVASDGSVYLYAPFAFDCRPRWFWTSFVLDWMHSSVPAYRQQCRCLMLKKELLLSEPIGRFDY